MFSFNFNEVFLFLAAQFIAIKNPKPQSILQKIAVWAL